MAVGATPRPPLDEHFGQVLRHSIHPCPPTPKSFNWGNIDWTWTRSWTQIGRLVWAMEDGPASVAIIARCSLRELAGSSRYSANSAWASVQQERFSEPTACPFRHAMSANLSPDLGGSRLWSRGYDDRPPMSEGCPMARLSRGATGGGGQQRTGSRRLETWSSSVLASWLGQPPALCTLSAMA